MTTGQIRRFILSSLIAGALSAAPGALAADLKPAEPALDMGWNTDWGLLFNLQDIFTSSAILGGYGGGFGIQRNLDPSTGIRISVSLSRSTDPAYESTTVTTGGGTTTTTNTFVVPSGPTSTLGLGLGAVYVKRFSTDPVSAYAGGGLSLTFNSADQSWTDTISVQNQTTSVANNTSTFGLGLNGVLGIDWRITRTFSLFAEYGLGITAFSTTNVSNDTKVTNSGNTGEQSTKASVGHVFDFSNGLAQGGALGLTAHF